MAVMVIGGSGFIGSHLVRHLAESDEKVVAFDSRPAITPLPAEAKFCLGDVTRLDSLLAALIAYGVKRVVNLAYVVQAEENLHTGLRLNVMGMNNVFEAARLLRLERVVYASSIAVYGTAAYFPDPVDEVTRCSPITIYGAAKLANEIAAREYNRRNNLSLVGLRISRVLGPLGRGEGFSQQVIAALRQAKEGASRIDLPYQAEARQSYVDVEFVARALADLLMAPAPRHAVYLTGGWNLSFGELGNIFRGMFPGLRVAYGDAGPPAEKDLVYDIITHRLQEEFNLVQEPVEERLASYGRSLKD